jgi:hypothetical protein
MYQMIDPNLISSYQLRLVNAFAWLAKRTSANSTKNFGRAGIAFIPLPIIAFQIIFINTVSF